MKYTLLIVHVLAYAAIAPFLGGFVICLCKYLRETNMDAFTAIACSTICGIGAIVLFGALGLLIAFASLPFVFWRSLNIASNLIASLSYMLLAYAELAEFMSGYLAAGVVTSVVFGLSVGSMELRVVRYLSHNDDSFSMSTNPPFQIEND